MEDLNHYCHNPLPGTISSNHTFVFGDSELIAAFKQQEYCDAAADEFYRLPVSLSSRISVGLSADKRAEDIKNLPEKR